jgi:hypothetical protein
MATAESGTESLRGLGSARLLVLTRCYDNIGVALAKLNFGAIVAIFICRDFSVTACFGCGTRFLP